MELECLVVFIIQGWAMRSLFPSDLPRTYKESSVLAFLHLVLHGSYVFFNLGRHVKLKNFKKELVLEVKVINYVLFQRGHNLGS